MGAAAAVGSCTTWHINSLWRLNRLLDFQRGCNKAPAAKVRPWHDETAARGYPNVPHPPRHWSVFRTGARKASKSGRARNPRALNPKPSTRRQHVSSTPGSRQPSSVLRRLHANRRPGVHGLLAAPESLGCWRQRPRRQIRGPAGDGNRKPVCSMRRRAR